MEDEGLLLSNQHLAPAAVIGLAARWASTSCASTRAGGRSRPRATPVAQPSGFNANDPNDARYSWAALDNAVRMVRDDRACA